MCERWEKKNFFGKMGRRPLHYSLSHYYMHRKKEWAEILIYFSYKKIHVAFSTFLYDYNESLRGNERLIK